jgi:hypothetical protein
VNYIYCTTTKIHNWNSKSQPDPVYPGGDGNGDGEGSTDHDLINVSFFPEDSANYRFVWTWRKPSTLPPKEARITQQRNEAFQTVERLQKTLDDVVRDRVVIVRMLASEKELSQLQTEEIKRLQDLILSLDASLREHTK